MRTGGNEGRSSKGRSSKGQPWEKEAKEGMKQGPEGKVMGIRK